MHHYIVRDIVRRGDRSGGRATLGVDCEPRIWSMDQTQIEPKITPRTKAIMVVQSTDCRLTWIR